MQYEIRKPAVLVLEDGTVFKGKTIGAIGTSSGEIAFNTGMSGYQEIFTDPSYFGQILIMTAAHIGNYGVKQEEIESNTIKLKGLVCKNFSQNYSRIAGINDLQSFLLRDNIVGISNVDTRALVRHIRDKGAMNAIISSENLDSVQLKKQLTKVPSMSGLELSSKVSTKKIFDYGVPTAKLKVAVLDLGVKNNILRCLAERGCYLRVFPMNTSSEEILAWNPNGVMLSNGPGDPSVMIDVVKNVKKLVSSDVPIFGICLGHQVLALSLGLTTYKMFNGHRGVNHPVKDIKTGHCVVTSQNHGFAVKSEDVDNFTNIEITHRHINDNTLAGIKLIDKPVFSVQYHPEASAGPDDTRYLFDEFVSNMEKSVADKKT